jgi:transcription-repair coupling factor (superfamily II helicase)
VAAVAEAPAAQALRGRLERGGAWSLGTVPGPVQPFFAAVVRHWFPDRPVVLVTDLLKSQESAQLDLETWMDGTTPDAGSRIPEGRPLFYPAWEVLPHETKLPHADVISERLQTLVALARCRMPDAGSQKASAKKKVSGAKIGFRDQGSGIRHPLIVTSVTALLQKTLPPDEITSRTRTLKRGDRIDPLDLIEWLEDQGYEPEAQVTMKGHIALRGGIVDVWPLPAHWPVRLEFFGDELESLREFDPISQISREQIEAVTVPPGGELGLIRRRILESGESFSPSSSFSFSSAEGKVRERGGEGERAGLGLATLLDYLPPNAIFLLCEPDLLDHAADHYAAQIPEGDAAFISWAEFQAELMVRKATVVSLTESLEDKVGQASSLPIFSEDGPDSSEDGSPPHPAFGHPLPSEGRGLESAAMVDELTFTTLDAFRPMGERPPEQQIAEAQRREFFAQLHRWLRQGWQVHVFCNTDGEKQRFGEVWEEYGFAENPKIEGQNPKTTRTPAKSKKSVRPLAFEPRTSLGSLRRGFLFEAAKLVVVTDAEIFGRYKVQRPRRLKSPHAQTTRSALDINFADLQEGDFVVHVQYGIARYLGLKVVPLGGKRRRGEAVPEKDEGQECLTLEFAPSNPDDEPPRLYVPVSEAHLVSKYVGAGKARPQLNTLSGTRWAKAKKDAEHAVRDLAAEFLQIQAARESQVGLSFPADAPWQREFEGSFPYEETPDQVKAIDATKADMEKPKPMDRLICGDVGFGKTEVAIRAAFKAVMGGKQVAILVPTTVLAQQHFNGFRERMADYPVSIELLSRFRTRKEQNKVLEGLASGQVDIVIGTHRLVQPDIEFKDLGLVVIDEEQRFGVLHKERFKLIRRMVDVLTLSATPIPRTLYLALTGARDMSTIETPPQDRLPVETIVTQYDERIIRDAIQRELNRGGQVYFLHNRVFDIDDVATKLKALVPEARFAVGHGQMSADDLEEVMTKFVNGEADVLLSTTIIESGLDIPNANTIIIDRADRFGLSGLYQLRGRVGRYKHQAYAYLLIPRHAGVLSDARKRLSALKQYSTLGSGFKIAMRDLEIRGAGNLLGAQQSGHITAVGFELYCQLLSQSVAALKGEKVKPRVETLLRIDFLAMNPGEEEAIPDSRSRTPDKKAKEPLPEIHIPRETATYSSHPESGIGDRSSGIGHPVSIPKAPAYLPLSYVPESAQRIELYRKLAQASDKTLLEGLKKEVRDRFGPLPPSAELLFLATELKHLAAEKGITSVETREDKLMLTRHGDFLQVGGKFPRLTKPDAKGRLTEIKRLLLAL